MDDYILPTRIPSIARATEKDAGVRQHNKDIFYKNVYKYFVQKGKRNIILHYGLNLLSFITVIFLTTFFLGCIDYGAFFRITNDNPINLYDIVNVKLLFSGWQILVLMFAIIGCIFLTIQIMSFIYKIMELKNIHYFFSTELNISDSILTNMTWDDVTTRIQEWYVSVAQPQIQPNSSANAPEWYVSVAQPQIQPNSSVNTPEWYASVAQPQIQPNSSTRVAVINTANTANRDTIEDVVGDSGLDVPRWYSTAMEQPSINHDIVDDINVPTSYHIASRIMRCENYLIALFNHNVLDIHIPIPLQCFRDYVYLNKTLEWNIQLSIFNIVFDDNDTVNHKLMTNTPEQDAELIYGLGKRFFFLGILNLIFMPFICVYLIIYFLFMYGEQFYHEPDKMGARHFSLMSAWKFREYNELPHVFETRQQRALPYVYKFFDHVPPNKWLPLFRFLIFLLSGFCVIFIAMGFANDYVLVNLSIFGRNILSYIGILGLCIAIFKPLLAEKKDPRKLPKYLRHIREHLHYIPQHWIYDTEHRGTNIDHVTGGMANIYEFQFSRMVKELVGVFFTPFIIWFSLHKCSRNIILFIKQHTKYVEGLGYICSFSDFNELPNDHGAETMDEIGLEGKLTRSLLNFGLEHPNKTPICTKLTDRLYHSIGEQTPHLSSSGKCEKISPSQTFMTALDHLILSDREGLVLSDISQPGDIPIYDSHIDDIV